MLRVYSVISLVLLLAVSCTTPTAARPDAAKSEQNANQIARAIGRAGGLETLPDPPHGYSTKKPLVFRNPNGEPVQTRTIGSTCTTDPRSLNAQSAKMNLSDLGLKSLQPIGLGLAKGRLDNPTVIVLTGERASLVQDSGVGIVSLSNGEYFVITPCVRPYANEGREPFRKVKLESAQLPELPNAEFLQADRVESVRTVTGLSTRYIGLWKQGGGSLIAEFIVPSDGARPEEAIPLMKSDLPIRSIDFFPSPDTPSGSVTLVQEAGRVVRVVKFDWWHG
jgi:hypothetical protein